MAHYERRGDIFHFRMRVPARFHAVESRSVIKETLRTDSEAEAAFEAEKRRRELIALWTARLAGADPRQPATIPFEQLESIARQRKGAYKPHTQMEVGELVRRLIALQIEDPEAKKPEVAAAVLGAVATPLLTVSGLVAFYERERRTENAGKDENAMRKWRNPLKLAAANFQEVAGNPRVDHLGADEALAFFDWWKDRVADGEVTADTANKNLGFMRLMVKAHDKRFRVARVNPFDGMTVSGGTKKAIKRAEFSDDWIRETLLGPDPLPGLNEEARDIVLICAMTGCRPSEVSGIQPKHIQLKATIPHLQIRQEGRRLKTEHSERDVPLLGVALEAIKRNPGAFPRYAGKATLSDTVNKYLRENGLLPTEHHTMYSLRHAFEGRMTRAKIDNREAASMMGHSLKGAIGREVYGDALTLERRLEIAKLIHIGDSE